MYEESAAVPLIVNGPGVETGICETPVSLIDLSETILDHFDAVLEGERPGQSLYQIAAQDEDQDRVVFSEYHAVGAVSGAFLVRKGRWKFIYYVRFAPELFDLQQDPEELSNLAEMAEYRQIVTELESDLRNICDPEAIDRQAHGDQQAMIEGYGGREAALKLGARGATPPPSTLNK